MIPWNLINVFFNPNVLPFGGFIKDLKTQVLFGDSLQYKSFNNPSCYCFSFSKIRLCCVDNDSNSSNLLLRVAPIEAPLCEFFVSRCRHRGPPTVCRQGGWSAVLSVFWHGDGGEDVQNGGVFGPWRLQKCTTISIDVYIYIVSIYIYMYINSFTGSVQGNISWKPQSVRTTQFPVDFPNKTNHW